MPDSNKVPPFKYKLPLRAPKLKELLAAKVPEVNVNPPVKALVPVNVTVPAVFTFTPTTQGYGPEAGAILPLILILPKALVPPSVRVLSPEIFRVPVIDNVPALLTRKLVLLLTVRVTVDPNVRLWLLASSRRIAVLAFPLMVAVPPSVRDWLAVEEIITSWPNPTDPVVNHKPAAVPVVTVPVSVG